MSHEIAHFVLDHSAEELSNANFMNLLVAIPLICIWASINSDIVSLLAHGIFMRFLKIAIELPFSREMEMEADEVK